MSPNLLGTLLRGRFVLLALLGTWPMPAHGQDPSWKTYVDTVHGYAFGYPPAYQVKASGYGLSLRDANARLRADVDVEDWTRPVTRGENRWDLATLAQDRARAFMIDGPDCSISCDVRKVDEVANSYGVRVVEVTRRRIARCQPPDTTSRMGPLYVADLSGSGAYYLLLFDLGLADPDLPIDTVQAILTTVRRLGHSQK